MINKHWMELIQKYSFIEKIERKGVYVFFSYLKKGKVCKKKIALRATGPQIQKVIKKIKVQVEVVENEKKEFRNYAIV